MRTSTKKNYIILLVERSYNIIILLSYQAKKSKIMKLILFKRALLMTEADRLALMEVSRGLGYIAYLKRMNDNYLMMNLGKLYG